jgi:outer membrane receptor protein involved in Fe transport
LVSPDNDLPLVNTLRLTGAVRYEQYKNVGEVATPKLGVLFAPIDAVTLKGSWGKSFKAPTLFQEYQARQGLLLPSFAFRNNPGGVTALYLAGGGGPLRPERATTWNVTANVRPHALEGLSIEASYFDVRYKDRIVSPISSISRSLNNPIYADLINYDPTVQQILEIVSGLPEGLSNQTGGPFDPAAVGAVIDSTLQNVARQHARGVDIAVEYGFEPTAGDEIDLSASASYLKSDRQLSSGQPTIRLAGTIFDPPHWRARMGGTWTRENGSLGAFANYIGGNKDDRQQPTGHVGSYTSFDVVAGLKATTASGIFSGFEARLAVTNLFNERPDRIENSDPADPPYDSANYSALGRTVSLTLKKAW